MVFFISVLVLNGSCLTLALRVLEYLARENYYSSIPVYQKNVILPQNIKMVLCK